MYESDKKATVILISQFALPYSQIGSWTTLYKNYLSIPSLIDAVICPKPDMFFEGVHYGIVKPDRFANLRRKFNWFPFAQYFRPLQKMLEPNHKYIIQIVDNSGIVGPLNQFLKKLNMRQNCLIQYFYHGFAPMFEGEKANEFMAAIDELVLLTHDSKKAHEQLHNQLNTKFSVLHNGIDTSKFYRVKWEKKLALRKKHDITSEIIFIWCSQDRPNKGLQIILDAWRRLEKGKPEIALLVIGAEPREPIQGVYYLGRILNDELAEYYQMGDMFLFPTQCQEGFGMSLIEAMHCGCLAIASTLGGVPEVLQYGKFGKLIDNPASVDSWVQAIQDYLKGNFDQYQFPENIYTMKNWNRDMDSIIGDAKDRI